MEAIGVPGRLRSAPGGQARACCGSRLDLCTRLLQKLNIHQAKCAAWWILEHSSVVEQPAYIQCVGGSIPSVPISKAKFFHFPFPFTKVIRQKNGTMAAVGAILKCHPDGTFLRVGESKATVR